MKRTGRNRPRPRILSLLRPARADIGMDTWPSPGAQTWGYLSPAVSQCFLCALRSTVENISLNVKLWPKEKGGIIGTAHHLEKVVDTYSIDFFVLRLPSVTYLKLSFLPFKFHCSCDFFSHYSSLITQTQYHFSSMTTKTLHHKFLKDAGLSVNHSQLVSLYTMQQPEVFH